MSYICKKCYWKEKGMFAGQGFRTYTCAICGEEYEWHNTNIPKICPSCSEKLGICQRCLEKLDEN